MRVDRPRCRAAVVGIDFAYPGFAAELRRRIYIFSTGDLPWLVGCCWVGSRLIEKACAVLGQEYDKRGCKMK